MCLSTAEIEAVVKDLAPRIEGGKVARIEQPDRHTFILHVRQAAARYWLQFVVHPRFSRLHLLTRRPKASKPAAGFCNVARRHVTGSPIRSMRCVERDRVVILELVGRDALKRERPLRLIAELTGTGSNLLLLDESDRILGAMSTQDSARRKVVPGGQYEPLPTPDSLPQKALVNRFADVQRDPGDELALSRAIQNTYRDLEAAAELDEKRSALLGAVRARLKALRSRARKLERDIENAHEAEALRRSGELLKIALPDLRKGMDNVIVKDLFDPDAPEVTIELDASKGPLENVEDYFRRYKKLKGSAEHVERRIVETRQQIGTLAALEGQIEGAERADALDALEPQLRRAAVALPGEKRPAARRKEKAGPRRFVSADGLEILVARNQRQNHELTFAIARGNDYWVHIVGWQGPHVIVRKPSGKDVPLETLLDAAHLAVYHSKVRGTDYAEVIYTQRKNVRPIKGEPGHVTYADVSTLQVRIEEARIKRLLAARRAAQTET